MRRRSLLALAPLCLPAGILPARSQAGRMPVVASFSILGDMLRQIGGDRLEVRVIAGPDADPHGFQPRPSDITALTGARLVVRNGLGFDPWFDRLVRASGYGGPVATATTGITPRTMVHSHAGHGHDGAGRRTSHRAEPARVADPHCWQDLRHGQAYVRTLAEALAGADPAGAALYQRNAQAYAGRLAGLDGWVRAQIGTVPEARRKVVTSHDALGYFGAAYGVTFLAPQGVSTEGEPSAQEVARLIRQIRAEGITAIFIENMFNPATLRRLAEEAGVAIRGRLYADSLSAPGGPAPTYEAMFRHNVGLMV
ncbi:MAG TPA: metal ABC transporter substrate-binding protein, partial [Acetobacteraceae bacterium]|nr:metal ABC transporter substrate-binding protein [Acetobacteraceae bacterium]